MTIRQYAASVGHEIVGKLTRRAEWECDIDPYTGRTWHNREGARHYSDEGGNEYITGPRGICICTAEGDVI